MIDSARSGVEITKMSYCSVCSNQTPTGFAPVRPNFAPLVKHTEALKPVHEELLSHNLRANNFYEYWSNLKHGDAHSANYELYPDDLVHKVDDAVEWYDQPGDDEWTICYIKKADAENPTGSKSEPWCQYGLKHYVYYVDYLPPGKYDSMWDLVTPAQWLTLNINIGKTRLYLQRLNDDFDWPSNDPTEGMTLAQEEDWVTQQLALAESGEFTSGRLYQL